MEIFAGVIISLAAFCGIFGAAVMLAGNSRRRRDAEYTERETEDSAFPVPCYRAPDDLLLYCPYREPKCGGCEFNINSDLFSINKPHTDHIRSLLKKVELRTNPPKIDGVYKGFIYETKKYGGSGKVIGEFTAYNENTYRVCMGVPAHLVIESWLCMTDILKYSDNGKKDITAIYISDLIIYKVPKELSEFHKQCTPKCNFSEECGGAAQTECLFALSRPPQSWCYVEEV